MTKKRKITTFSKIKEITRVDEKTFYVPSSDPDKDPYFVFNSSNIGFCCDCMHYVMNLQDSGKSVECKHIKMVKSTYNIQ